MKKVLITNAVPDDVLQPLDGLAEVIQGPHGGPTMSRDEVLDLTPELVGIINQGELIVDPELLDQGKDLKIIANVAIGYNNLDVDLMAERGIWATNTPDAFVESTADCTLGMIITVLRKMQFADPYVRSGQWEQDGFQPGVWDGILLAGKTLGIVGYGQIGKAVEIRAKAFGMKVIHHNRTITDSPDYRLLDNLLAESDVVSLHVPLTKETHHLIDAQRLAQMKPGAYLVNMARGPVVYEEAIVEALKTNQLAGAALDVFEDEPRVHPGLLELDNVYLAPHIGGGTLQSRHESRLLCTQNIAAVLRGEQPLTPVNKPKNR